jgi:hypothetical protein
VSNAISGADGVFIDLPHQMGPIETYQELPIVNLEEEDVGRDIDNVAFQRCQHSAHIDWEENVSLQLSVLGCPLLRHSIMGEKRRKKERPK